MKWQVIAPDGERVIICEGYIRHELKHGSYVRAEHLVQMFPQFFVRILEEEDLPKIVNEDKIEELQEVEEVEEAIPEIKVESKTKVVKKKSGRPKKG